MPAYMRDHHRNRRWRASVQRDHTYRSLGYFTTFEEAKAAEDEYLGLGPGPASSASLSARAVGRAAQASATGEPAAAPRGAPPFATVPPDASGDAGSSDDGDAAAKGGARYYGVYWHAQSAKYQARARVGGLLVAQAKGSQ